jgi:flagellar hook-length control protein FliK
MTTDRTQPARSTAPTVRSAAPAERRDDGAFAALLDAHATPQREETSGRRADVPAARTEVPVRRDATTPRPERHVNRDAAQPRPERPVEPTPADAAAAPEVAETGETPGPVAGQPATPALALLPAFAATPELPTAADAPAPAFSMPVPTAPAAAAAAVVPIVAPAIVPPTAVTAPAADPGAETAVATATQAAPSVTVATPAPTAAAPASLAATPTSAPAAGADAEAGDAAPQQSGTPSTPAAPAPSSAPAAQEPAASAPATAPAAEPAAAAPTVASAPVAADQATTASAPATAPTAEPIAPTPPATQVPAGDIAQRTTPLHRAPAAVATLLQVAVDRGITHAKMTLRPAELGGIEIRLQATAAGIAAQVIADSPEAARLLVQAGDDLRRALEARNVTLISLDVSTTADQQRDSARGEWRDGDDAGRFGSRGSSGDAESDAEPAPISHSVIELPGGLLVDVFA